MLFFWWRNLHFFCQFFPEFFVFFRTSISQCVSFLLNDLVFSSITHNPGDDAYLETIFPVHSQCWMRCPPVVFQPETVEEVSAYVINGKFFFCATTFVADCICETSTPVADFRCEFSKASAFIVMKTAVALALCKKGGNHSCVFNKRWKTTSSSL